MTARTPNPGYPPRRPPPVREEPPAVGAVDNPADSLHSALIVTD